MPIFLMAYRGGGNYQKMYFIFDINNIFVERIISRQVKFSYVSWACIPSNFIILSKLSSFNKIYKSLCFSKDVPFMSMTECIIRWFSTYAELEINMLSTPHLAFLFSLSLLLEEISYTGCPPKKAERLIFFTLTLKNIAYFDFIR